MLAVILQSTITLAAVALGWFLNDRSRRSREDKAATGRALITLLFFRRRSAALKFFIQDFGKMGIISDAQQPELHSYFDRVVPRLVGWEKDYDEAVNYLAGINPLMAMKLRTAAMRSTFQPPPIQWSSDAGEFKASWTNLMATHLLDPSKLDDPIRQIARLHSRKVLRDVEREIAEQDSSAPELTELIERLIPFARVPPNDPSQS